MFDQSMNELLRLPEGAHVTMLLAAFAIGGCLGDARANDVAPGEPVAARLRDEESVRSLAYCYGRGLDELSIHHADRAKGRKLATDMFQSCFDPAITIEVFALGGTTPLRRTDGVAAWVGFADEFFATNRYTSTRHLMSNFSVEFTGANSARLISYASIPHFISSAAKEPKDAGASVEYMIARYVDEAVRQSDGRWRTTKKTVYLEEIWRGIGFFPGGQGAGL